MNIFILLAASLTVFVTFGQAKPNAEHQTRTLVEREETYECPEPFTMFGEYCYFFSDDFEYWHGAEAACTVLNIEAHLVRPYTQEIDEYVLSYVRTTNDNFWNDVNCIETSDTCRHFMYSNGEDLTYTNWATSQPDAGGPNCFIECDEDCGMYWKHPGREFKWNDAGCWSARNRYVCQMDRVPVYSY